MRVILVEGITDVNLVRYVYSKMASNNSFDDFIPPRRGGTTKVVTFENQKNQQLKIINLKGQDNLLSTLQEIIKPIENEISKIGIITDADKDFEASKDAVEKAVEESGISNDKITSFLTPNNQYLGNLETLLLSTLTKEEIPQLQCFNEYKKCLIESVEDIEKRAIDKHEVEAYIKFSKKPRNRNQAQFSFVDEKGDTGLWDLSKDEFQPIISFVESIFKN